MLMWFACKLDFFFIAVCCEYNGGRHTSWMDLWGQSQRGLWYGGSHSKFLSFPEMIWFDCTRYVGVYLYYDICKYHVHFQKELDTYFVNCMQLHEEQSALTYFFQDFKHPLMCTCEVPPRWLYLCSRQQFYGPQLRTPP